MQKHILLLATGLVFVHSLICQIAFGKTFSSGDFHASLFKLLEKGAAAEDLPCVSDAYDPLFTYLKSVDKDASFKKMLAKRRLQLELSGETGKGKFFSIEIRPGENHQKKKHKAAGGDLPQIYAFLDGKYVTLASLGKEDTPVFRRLHPEIKKSLKKQMIEYEKLYSQQLIAEIDRRRQAPPRMDVQKDVTNFSQLRKNSYWVVNSAGKAIRTELKAILFDFYGDAGPRQILGELVISPKNPIFAYLAAKKTRPPKLIRPRPPKTTPMKLSDHIIMVPTSFKNQYYIASVKNTSSFFELLWDAHENVATFLTVKSGYCLGNVRRVQDHNYGIEIGSRMYLLRNSRGYSQLISFEEKQVISHVLADKTAPEI